MGLLDDVFENDANDVSDASVQIILTQSPIREEKDKTYVNNLGTCVTNVTNATDESSHIFCGNCQDFTPDQINPVAGAGDCLKFFLPDGRRNIVRYPTQIPKNDTCFERRHA